jgi:hypothetical protein
MSRRSLMPLMSSKRPTKEIAPPALLIVHHFYQLTMLCIRGSSYYFENEPSLCTWSSRRVEYNEYVTFFTIECLHLLRTLVQCLLYRVHSVIPYWRANKWLWLFASFKPHR